ncbi:MAG TPA: cupin domain-containing protein [Pirellulales bacterium]|nr:cupin domain-containing protein [Pirellulales bacterium]
MALPRAQLNEVIDIRPLGADIATSPTSTLLVTDALEVIRLVMPAGKKIPTHQVPGEITVQCLEGKIEFTAGDRSHALRAGEMLGLPGGCPHALHALVDATVLVTILLKK